MDSLQALLPFLLIFVVFWLLLIRPQRKRQQEMTRLQNSVGVGSEVMLGSGIFGTVAAVEDDTLTLTIAPGTDVKVMRQAVVRVVSGAGTEEESTQRPADTPEQP